MQSDDMIGNITEHYISHVKLSDMTDNQKKELLNYTQNVSIIQKEYKKHENGYIYYIKLNVGWDIITYKYMNRQYAGWVLSGLLLLSVIFSIIYNYAVSIINSLAIP